MLCPLLEQGHVRVCPLTGVSVDIALTACVVSLLRYMPVLVSLLLIKQMV